MTTLQLNIVALEDELLDYGYYDLVQSTPFPSTDPEQIPVRSSLTFYSAQLLHSGKSEVYRGTLRDAAGFEKVVICKLIEGDYFSVEYEADLYCTKLSQAQGAFVPHFYGLYTGTIRGSDKPAGCILLEDCGDALNRPLYECDMVLRQTAVLVLVHIHVLGISHNDFGPQHIIVDAQQNIRIVGFDRANSHTCERTMKVTPYHFPPKASEFGCQEIYEALLRAEIWTPSLVAFLGGVVLIESTPDLESLVAFGQHTAREFSDDYIEKEARELLAWFRERYKDRLAILGFPETDSNDVEMPD